MNLPLEQPWFLLLIPLGIGAVWMLVRQERGIGFSSVSLLEGMRGISYVLLQRFILSVFVVAGAVVLAKPFELVRTAIPIYAESRDIVVVLDISSSMSAGTPSNLQISQRVIADFAAGRPGDRMSLFTFDTRSFMEWPLSLDRSSLIYRLERIRTTGGTKIAEGMIGGLNHLHNSGSSRGAIIVVSDGLSVIKDEDRETIFRLVEETHTRVYWILTGNLEYRLPQEFADFVKQLGGTVYRVNPQDLDDIFAEISRLETSPVVIEHKFQNSYRFGIWAILALISLAAAAVVDLLKEV